MAHGSTRTRRRAVLLFSVRFCTDRWSRRTRKEEGESNQPLSVARDLTRHPLAVTLMGTSNLVCFLFYPFLLPFIFLFKVWAWWWEESEPRRLGFLHRGHVGHKPPPSGSDGYVRSRLFSDFLPIPPPFLFFNLKFGRGGVRSQSHEGSDSSTMIT